MKRFVALARVSSLNFTTFSKVTFSKLYSDFKSDSKVMFKRDKRLRREVRDCSFYQPFLPWAVSEPGA